MTVAMKKKLAPDENPHQDMLRHTQGEKGNQREMDWKKKTNYTVCWEGAGGLEKTKKIMQSAGKVQEEVQLLQGGSWPWPPLPQGHSKGSRSTTGGKGA